MSSQTTYTSASLYVGDLAPEVTEGQLFEVFRTIGPVASIRVCRDAVTKRSLGYGYINFHDVGAAERALEQLNFTPVVGKPCRLMWSQRDPAKRKSGVGNIFIKNLDKSIGNSALHDTFSAFGNIISCKVEVDQHGASKGYGYVHFETQEEAEQAIAKVNGMQVAGKIVFVGTFQPKKARGADGPVSTFTNIYVKNLDPSVNKEKLEEMFGVHGKITSSAIMVNEKGESKGFGFINYDKPEFAQAAVEKLNGVTVDGKQLFVGRAQKRQERDEVLRQQRAEQLQKYQGANVYVKNLDDNIDDEKLQQEFARFGPIVRVKVMTDERGNSKGFGFVAYHSADDASRAINEMNGVILGTKPLYASLAQKKEVRRTHLALLHQQKLLSGQVKMGPGVPMMNMRGPIPFGTSPAVYFPPPMGQFNQPAYAPQMVPRGPRFNPPQPAAPAGAGTALPQQQHQPQGAQQQQMQQPPFARGAGFQQQGGGTAPSANGPAQGQPFQQRQPNRPRNPRPPPIQQQPQQQSQQAQQQPNGGGRGRGQNAQGQLNRTYKYNPTARNLPGAGFVQPAYPAYIQKPEEDPEASKQMAGEQLYAYIQKVQPDLAGKITGMLIESLELRELYGLMHSPMHLDAKINEALAVLHESGETESGQVNM